MRYKLFGRGTGLRVSELALGCGAFGTRWGYGAEPAEARRIFDAYLDAGGNFLDAADAYQFGQAEELLGDFLGERRNDVVLATKFTSSTSPSPSVAHVGNSRRVMIDAVEASLRRLRTDRVDMLWVHMPDGVTSTDEIMRGLNDLVSAGKVVYIGLSDFPAWRTARAATIAELRGWAPLAGIQIEYSLAERTPDRELLPMAKAMGLGITGWSPLGGGLLSGKYRRGEQGRADTFKRLIHAEDDARKVATMDAVIALAEERRLTPAQISIAWSVSRGVIPIVGARSFEQASENLGAAGVDLTQGEIGRLDVASRMQLGFPHDFLSTREQRTKLAGGNLDLVEEPSEPVA